MEAVAVMGYGDDIMASGMAKGLYANGKRAAFGDGKRIIWGPWSEEIFHNNPNVARPGDEGAHDLCWLSYYKGNRRYNRMSEDRRRWIWNYDFKPIPGQIFFTDAEIKYAAALGHGYVVIEPNVPWHKSVAVNKDWGLEKYQAITDRFLKEGYDVVQFSHGRDRLNGARAVVTPTFRHALAALSRARLAVLPEGGLHHGAAALGVRAVVIYGGFIPPQVTGYSLHVNLTGDALACGSLWRCLHCRAALDRISVDEVWHAGKTLH